MPIKIDGQFEFQFSIGSHSDFVTNENISLFKIVEEVGNILPTFELAFYSGKEDLCNSVNEGTKIKVMFSDSVSKKKYNMLRIISSWQI